MGAFLYVLIWTVLAKLVVCNASVADFATSMHRYCPLSQSITGPSLTTGLFSYPINIYGDNDTLNIVKQNDNLRFNCEFYSQVIIPQLFHLFTVDNAFCTLNVEGTSIELNKELYFDRHHICSTSKICPIHRQNLNHAIQRSRDWSTLQYMCDLNLHIAKQSPNKTINIVVLGGSVTAGQFTRGHTCEERFDSKCKGFPGSTNSNRDISWGRYLKEWFEVRKMPNVKVHLLAQHGFSSAIMNEHIFDKLNSVGLTNLSSTDLFLLDHSYNDGLYLAKFKVLTMQRGLEGIIRKIYSLSNDVNSLPRIVIMETLAYLPHWIPFYQDYQVFYAEIAKHYKIPIWSIRDAVNSNYTLQKQSSYAKVLQHDVSVRYDQHPGWHLHLFYADMVAALLRSLTNKCTSLPLAVSKPPAAIPPPLLANISKSCDQNNPLLLDISAEKVINNRTILGTWTRSSTDPASWELKSEGRGRVGWIQEDHGKSSNLTFHPVDPKRTLGVNGKSPHLIQIQYMRTYKNAGQARVFVCGNLMQGDVGMVRGNLDALWTSYEHYKFSLPEFKDIVFPKFGVHCKDPNDLGIRFEFVNDVQCRSKRGSKSAECLREAEARTVSKKFKIISIKICPLA